VVQPTNGFHTLRRDEGQPFWFLGTLTTIKATGEQTGGVFGLIEQISPPGFGPPPHVHYNEDEAFYILEGEVTFYCGEETFHATAGSYVFFPRGVPHRFEVGGTKPAKLIQLNTPAGFEHFFAEVGTPAQELTLPPEGPPDIEKMMALQKKYNFEFLLPQNQD
jgi:mannose-6-phosphate isomerase-like protein (cupin superfamily)